MLKDSKELVKTNPEVLGIHTNVKKQPSKLYKTSSKIIIKPKTMEEWYSKYLKCECQNAFTSRTFSSVYDSKIIIFNCIGFNLNFYGLKMIFY